VKKYREPILVSSVDGVGTKLKLAFALDKHDTIGADLVNHSRERHRRAGRGPLFFLDYLGTGKLEPHVFTESSRASPALCAENNCALIGGETRRCRAFKPAGRIRFERHDCRVVEKIQDAHGQKTIKRGDGGHRHRIERAAYQRLFARSENFLRAVETETVQPHPRLELALGAELLKVHVSYGRWWAEAVEEVPIKAA